MSKKTNLNPAQKVILFLIKTYQKWWSPDHSWRKVKYPHGYCRFYPSCSEYTVEAVTKYGAIKGSLLGFWRVLRCNPWVKPGPDPLK